MKILTAGSPSGRPHLFLRAAAALAFATLAVLSPAAAHAQEDNYHYANLWDLSPGLSYMNTPTGAHIPWRSQLAGVDVSATQWLWRNLGATGDVRSYLSPGNVAPNPYFVNSPLISDSQFVGGAEYRWVKNSTFGINFHALAGAAYGDFSIHVPAGITNSQLGLYPNGASFAIVAGPVFDFHRNSSYSIRVVPNYTATHFGGEFQNNFSLSAQIVLHYGKF